MAKAKRLTDRPHFGARILLRIALVLFVLFCAVSIVTLQNQIAEKKRQLAVIEANIESVAAENDELADLIKADDIGRYMEKLAVENNGYAYPDERRYYDTSRD
ncbi:MAG: hypothetical protein J5851_00290 [Oscillospiraceae bacterium]|nr:hypothetical protein [Oscillospiraceae bacterium]